MKLCWLLFLVVLKVNAQDTSFVQSISLSDHGYIRNITSDPNTLYLRIEDSIYKWSNNELNYIQKGYSRYSWVKNDINDYYWIHNENVSRNKQSFGTVAKKLIPGKINKTTTHARIKDKLYISHNGKLLEYNINSLTKLFHEGRSIRNIYSEPDFRIISTYSGVFLDTDYRVFKDDNLSQDPEFYSNGKFVKLDTSYFLCQDGLLLYDKKTQKFDVLIHNNGEQMFRNILQSETKNFGVLNDGIVDLNIKERRIGDYLYSGAVVDAISHKNTIYFITSDGLLGEIESDGSIKTYPSGLELTEITLIDNTIYIGSRNGLYTFKNGQFNCLLANYEVIELIDWNGTMIFSNNTGLYAIINNRALSIHENIEFNKHALSKDPYFLYAGSVNGLYVISSDQLNDWINLKTNESFIQNLKTPWFQRAHYWIYSLLTVTLIIVYYKYHNSQKLAQLSRDRLKFDIEYLEMLIRKNHKIKSVNDLADHLNTSVVQLNRKLKEQNTKPLVILQNVKKDLCIEMFDQGAKLSEIAKRVGYSERYIKENFLKNHKQ